MTLGVWVSADHSLSIALVQSVFWILSIVTAFGLVGVIAHWKWRTAGPAFATLTVFSMFLGLHPWITAALLAGCVLASFVTPIGNVTAAELEAIRSERDDALQKALAAEQGTKPLITERNELLQKTDSLQKHVADLEHNYRAVEQGKVSAIREASVLRTEVQVLTAELNEIKERQKLLGPWLIDRAQRIREFMKRDATANAYIVEFNYGDIEKLIGRLPLFPMDSTTRDMLRHDLTTLPFYKEDVEKIANALEKLAYIVPDGALV